MGVNASGGRFRWTWSSWSVCGLLAGVVGGTIVQLQQATLFPAGVYMACTLAAGCGLVGLLLAARLSGHGGGRRSSWWVAGMVSLAALLLGFGAAGWRADRFGRTALDPALEGRVLVVNGQVLAMPQTGEDGTRFRFAVESASSDGLAVQLPPQIYLGWYAGFGAREARDARSLVADAVDPADFALELQRQPQVMRAGERWQVTVKLKAPHGGSNPDGFDYELWLWEQGLQATGYVRAGARDAPPRKLADSWAHPVERARQSVRDAVYERVANRQLAGVLAALVTGDQNAIERADWDVFRATGVAHLMSISGLHITMFAWVASGLIAWLWRRSVRLTPRLCFAVPAVTAGALGGLLLAALYALFSGWGVPAQRTICMLATVVLLKQGGRHWPWPAVWLTAMAVVVALDPWALMQAGFWLSFIAVGILFATDSGAGGADEKPAPGVFLSPDGFRGRLVSLFLPSSGLRRAAREQWIVTLALTPLSLLLFNQVSLVGLAANAVAIPAVTLLVTPLAMLGVLWAPVWDFAAGAVAGLVVFLQWLASWPMASLSVAAAPLWCAVAGVAGGALLAMPLPWNWRLLGLPLILPVLLWQPLRPPAGEFEVLGADIGQGNAVLVRTAGHSLLYDTGPRFSRDSDAGHRVLVPLLRAMDERLDMLVLSHRDLDHIGGAPAVLAMQPQARLLSSIEDSHELQAVRPSTRCVVGQHWRWDGVDFDILRPEPGDYDAGGKSNGMSCVLRVSNGRQTALLAGDIELPQEIQLLGNPAIRADFLLVPHHGSKTSSSGPFLDEVKPRFALAQAGYRNRFGHPAEPVMARYQARGITVVTSPVCGAATWRSDRPESVRCQRTQARRYWQHQITVPS